jgi:hypothetical protein
VVMAYRIIHGLVMIPNQQFIPTTVDTRGHNMKYRQISARTNYYHHTFFPSVIPMWNALPETVASAKTLDEFKTKLADVSVT